MRALEIQTDKVRLSGKTAIDKVLSDEVVPIGRVDSSPKVAAHTSIFKLENRIITHSLNDFGSCVLRNLSHAASASATLSYLGEDGSPK